MSTCTEQMPQSVTAPIEEPASDDRPLRVCHLSMTLATGGLERLLVEFSRFHDARRFELLYAAFTETGQPAQDLRDLGHSVLSLDWQQAGRVYSLFKLRDFLRREQVDILHTHNTYPQFYGAIAAKLAGVPVVINTQHGRGCGPNWKAVAQFRLANRFTQRIIAVSEDAAQICRKQDPSSSAKIDAVWNGIDLKRFEYRGPIDQPIAVCVARLAPEKDFPTLLKATQIVVQQVPNFRLRIAGDGTEREKLEALSRSLGVNEHVEFLGERTDIPRVLSEAAFFVSSSQTEGISLTLLEAMAVGLPIMATRVGGNPEIVQDGITGYLVPSENPEALADSMIRMCRADESRPGMGRLGRSRVEANFSASAMVERYERLYAELAATRR